MAVRNPTPVGGLEERIARLRDDAALAQRVTEGILADAEALGGTYELAARLRVADICLRGAVRNLRTILTEGLDAGL